ncbi:MAG: PleD family two-component system response regulator [Thiohalomonadales bacterium]
MASLVLKNLFNRTTTQKDRRTRSRSSNKPSATILIVDDSRTVVHMLKTALTQAGYTTLAAADGERGIQLARSHRPDLILMDVIMPGINGFQATRLLRKDPTTSDIPIIIISGSEQATEKVWVMRLGANDFIPKPIERGPLFTKVEQILRESELAKLHKLKATENNHSDPLYD